MNNKLIELKELTKSEQLPQIRRIKLEAANAEPIQMELQIDFLELLKTGKVVFRLN